MIGGRPFDTEDEMIEHHLGVLERMLDATAIHIVVIPVEQMIGSDRNAKRQMLEFAAPPHVDLSGQMFLALLIKRLELAAQVGGGQRNGVARGFVVVVQAEIYAHGERGITLVTGIEELRLCPDTQSVVNGITDGSLQAHILHAKTTGRNALLIIAVEIAIVDKTHTDRPSAHLQESSSIGCIPQIDITHVARIADCNLPRHFGT